jgi:integrase
VDFVQSQFLDSNLLAQLNDQARALVLMMIETGARESELIGLTPDDYFLDAEIPHIWIRKNKLRTLKTKSSDRKIPLVGISLVAAREVAFEGIVRYQGNPYSASGTINKYLADNGLKPTAKHSLYSLRHTFKDRLRDAAAPEEVIDELMGHKKSGPKYGRGHLLETKHEWLTKIAFKVPKHLRK